MESLILRDTVEYLLANCFRNKKEIACKIGVSYRSLLNCCAGKGTHRAMDGPDIKTSCILRKNMIGLPQLVLSYFPYSGYFSANMTIRKNLFEKCQ